MKKSGWAWPVVATAAILILGLWGVGVVFIIDTITQPANSLAGAIFLDILIVLSAAAMSVAVVWFLRGVSSTRSAIIVWQMTVIGIGIASAQGGEPRGELAVALIAPATVVTILMLFNRDISRHLEPDA
ncbi:MAG: hypothetical protein NWS64_02250 [Microbacteriaceae bacterium]|nr:hypothetical protein [Microbacteriaceae bacterium]